jgi:hypothetical protein
MNMKKTIQTILMTMVLMVSSVAPGFAGAEGGPQSNSFRLSARSYRTFTVRFVAGEVAEVALRGDGDTDLDLFVYDELGNLIAADEDNTDFCVVRWVPKWTGRFTIKVVNHGFVYNDFRIATN